MAGWTVVLDKLCLSGLFICTTIIVISVMVTIAAPTMGKCKMGAKAMSMFPNMVVNMPCNTSGISNTCRFIRELQKISKVTEIRNNLL